MGPRRGERREREREKIASSHIPVLGGFRSTGLDWTSITERVGGGLQNGRGGGGQVKFYPYKTGDGKSFSDAEGGGTKGFGVVLTRALKVLAVLKLEGRGHKRLPPFKRGVGAGKV